MDLFHVQQEEEGGQAQISNKTQKEDHMKSINPLKMDHISLALTFLGILEFAMILFLLFDITRCGPETTAKTIIAYIFIGLYQISFYTSLFVLMIYRKLISHGMIGSLLYPKISKERVLSTYLPVLSIMMSIFVIYIFTAHRRFSPEILPVCTAIFTNWLLTVLPKFLCLLRKSA